MPSISVSVNPDNVPRGTTITIQANVGDLPPGGDVTVTFEKGVIGESKLTNLGNVKVEADSNGQGVAEFPYTIAQDDPSTIPFYAGYKLQGIKVKASDDVHVTES